MTHPGTTTRIYLIGFMGAGKSYWGRRWAKAMNWAFFETDDLIEAREGMTITAIFETKGEAYFREQERIVITALATTENAIVSTGGGLPCFGDNMALLNASGITLFLSASPATIAARLQTARKKRPLLNGITPEQLPAFIEQRLAQRLPFYQQAQFSLEVNNLDDTTLSSLLQTLT